MENLTGWIHRYSGIKPETQENLLISVLVILLLALFRAIVLRIAWSRTQDVTIRYRWRKITTYVTVVLGILLVIRVWFAGIQSLATFFGLITAGLAIALKDLVTSLAGWLFILWRRPFQVGDRIQIGHFRGDVIDVRVFKFSVMEIGNWVDADQSTGRVVHIPNNLIFTEVMANYSTGFQFIWNEIPVLITFESNWKKAKGILEKISVKHAEHLSKPAEERIREASKRFMIFYTSLTPRVYTTVKDSGVLLTIRYLIQPRKRRGSEEGIWEDILREFARCPDIDFAYPTTRFYSNLKEGKSGTKPQE